VALAVGTGGGTRSTIRDVDMALVEEDVRAWCTCSCGGACAGPAEKTLVPPRNPQSRMAGLAPHMGQGLEVCVACAEARSVMWSDLGRRVRTVAPAEISGTQAGFKELASSLEGKDALFLDFLECFARAVVGVAVGVRWRSLHRSPLPPSPFLLSVVTWRWRSTLPSLPLC
jgi:hypothetical protein